MAARKSTPAPVADAVTTEDVLRSIYNTTTDGQSSLFAVVEDLGIDSGDVLTLLENVSDDFLDSDSKGNLWLTGDYFDAADMLSNYHATHAPEGVTVLGTDDMAALIESVKSVDTTPEAPVESSQTDDTEGTDVNNSTTPETTTDKGWTNDGGPTHFVEFDPSNPVVTGHTLLPQPETIPAPPEGVNANAWELAHTAETLPGRTYWAKVIKAQQEAYKAAEVAKEEKRAEMLAALPLDPMTGKPLSF